jgi:hypothetical protein
MAIALDATASNLAVNSATITIPNFTATPGTLIRVDSAIRATTDTTGVTYNGVSLTELFDQNLASAGSLRVASYIGIAGPDGAPHDVVVTLAASPGGVSEIARVSSWSGVDISSIAAAHRTIYSAGDTAGAGANVTVVDSVAGDVVVSANWTTGTSITNVETVVGIDNDVAGDGRSFGVQYKVATGASTVMAWTGDALCTHVAYALVPAAEVPPIEDQPETLHVIRSGIRLQ